MKHLKLYEYASFEIANALELIFDSDKLRLDHMEVHTATKTIYMKIYRRLSSDSVDDYIEFFNILKKYNLKWKLEDLKSIVIDYSKVNMKELRVFLDANKYNI